MKCVDDVLRLRNILFKHKILIMKNYKDLELKEMPKDEPQKSAL